MGLGLLDGPEELFLDVQHFRIENHCWAVG
jgi:hypothetical protein